MDENVASQRVPRGMCWQVACYVSEIELRSMKERFDVITTLYGETEVSSTLARRFALQSDRVSKAIT